MRYTKYTEGYTRQTFDTALGKFVNQEFVAGDQVIWEDEQGEHIDHSFWDEKQFGPAGPYLPYLNEDLKVSESPDALREKKIEALINEDIRGITQDLAEGDSSYLMEILSGEDWVQYSKMTNEDINEEYKNLQDRTK